ncbi:MAG: hypothetical protein A2Y78_08425 [Acidobacteria bacterium RBG_13_68_16]|nr:MAG: hypothetical protein A2Y78_08425 [Acidobacteria bacterium RBG_13_68_16]
MTRDEAFRRTYRITTARGTILGRSDLLRRVPWSLADSLKVPRDLVRAVLDDHDWLMRHKSLIPSRLAEDLVFEAHARYLASKEPSP